MHTLFQGLQGLAAIVAFVCFVLIVIRMFTSGDMGWGIATIALAIFCGIGFILALIWGWTHAKVQNTQTLMIVYTVCLVIGLLASGGYFAAGGGLPRFGR